MPLTLADIGEENIIKKIGGKPDVKQHLENLGFVVGGAVSIVSSIGGNLIVNVKDSRVAISKEMASKIMVQEDIQMKTLKEAKVGETLQVVKLHGEGAVKRRIMDMGITRGVEVHIRKVAPLGDPVEITVRGYELSLRKADAEMIEVENIQAIKSNPNRGLNWLICPYSVLKSLGIRKVFLRFCALTKNKSAQFKLRSTKMLGVKMNLGF